MKVMTSYAGMELIDCQQTILDEIAEPRMKHLDIAKTYALTIRSSEREQVDWPAVNAAIVRRWSHAGLRWIKDRAWSGKAFKA